MNYAPASFGKRFVAAFVDGIIVSVLSFPISFLMALVVGMVAGADTAAGVSVQIISTILNYFFIILFMGWFYKNKGATPGKLLMKLKLVKADTGRNIGYLETFIREIIGKTISTLILFIGYLMVLFRKDKRALHDLMVNTQVLDTQSPA